MKTGKPNINPRKPKHNKVLHAACERINQLAKEVSEIIDERKHRNVAA